MILSRRTSGKGRELLPRNPPGVWTWGHLDATYRYEQKLACQWVLLKTEAHLLETLWLSCLIFNLGLYKLDSTTNKVRKARKILDLIQSTYSRMKLEWLQQHLGFKRIVVPNSSEEILSSTMQPKPLALGTPNPLRYPCMQGPGSLKV